MFPVHGTSVGRVLDLTQDIVRLTPSGVCSLPHSVDGPANAQTG